eukprot:GDKJ01019267.1.p1 GENE.GDKJ01019267.1~~GDKJ01019267.1.p1  ORF type:complete len:223 (+),score=-9.23 GDKJ01019267.1:30-671(+)
MDKPAQILIIGQTEPLPGREYVRMRTEAPSEPSTTYAVHHSIVRQCRLLDIALDESDLQVDGDLARPAMADITAVIPDCTKDTAELVFKYLKLTAVRIPTILSRPLKAPLEELVQPWEREFLVESCLENRDPSRHRPLLNIMRAAEFLVIDSLRDLCCAFLASLVLKCSSEQEVLNVLGLPRAATAEELQPVLELYPFLRPAVATSSSAPSAR